MPDQPLVDSLVQEGLALAATAGGELERSCWMVVHEHHHGVKPTEYDIREIDEDLYLAVCCRLLVSRNKGSQGICCPQYFSLPQLEDSARR